MKKTHRELLCALVLSVVAASPLWAQRSQDGGIHGFGRDLLVLLQQKPVQDELKLSDDQQKKASEKFKEANATLEKLKGDEREKKLEEFATANDKVVKEILKEGQFERLKQISVQLRGPFDPETAKTLKITDDQTEKADALRKDLQKEFESIGPGDGEEKQKKREALAKSGRAKALALLTSEQKAKFEKMSGPEFTPKG